MVVIDPGLGCGRTSALLELYNNEKTWQREDVASGISVDYLGCSFVTWMYIWVLTVYMNNTVRTSTTRSLQSSLLLQFLPSSHPYPQLYLPSTYSKWSSAFTSCFQVLFPTPRSLGRNSCFLNHWHATLQCLSLNLPTPHPWAPSPTNNTWKPQSVMIGVQLNTIDFNIQILWVSQQLRH